LPEIGTLGAQVGNSRLAMAARGITAAASRFETHRSAPVLVEPKRPACAAMLLSARPSSILAAAVTGGGATE
jgi:hypothetical protein